MTIIDTCLDILRRTHDGNDLSPDDLKLVEYAVNGFLTEKGECALYELQSNCEKGYKKPWLFGVEHMTMDHEGYVYYKNQHFEHFHGSALINNEANLKNLLEMKQRCEKLESEGQKISAVTVIWKWED